MFRLTLTLTKLELVDFLDQMGPHMGGMVVRSLGEDSTVAPPFVEPAPEPVKKARPKRGSVVNDIILRALAGGPRPVAELKQALVDGGRAPGSLSTGLAFLQASGDVERGSEGIYQLKVREAAQ
jgi:hypothetical protein